LRGLDAQGARPLASVAALDEDRPERVFFDMKE
jgi:hypothetical protein